MTACRRARRLPLAVVAALAVTSALAWPTGASAADNPNGKIVLEVLPAGNRIHTPDQIRSMMHTRPGVAYEEATVQEDVRRLTATKWFIPGGVVIHTRIEPDNRVTVFVYVTELTNVVQDVQYVGAQHLRMNELQNLSGVRKGEPMNPAANALGAQAIKRKYQDDGRYYATVELVEGNKLTDTRVVYNIVEGPDVKVAGIDFLGVDHASVARLRTQLVTKKAFAGLIGGKFNPISMDLDRQKLIEYYEALGFLDVKIDSEVVPMRDHQVRIAYHIAEGKQYRVAGKQIDGAKSYPLDTLSPLADELKPGERYDRRLSEANKERIKAYYGSRGHQVMVEEKRYAVPDQPGVVQVHYEVLNDRGTPDRVGRIIIDGNTVTKDRVILNQLTDFAPGQILPYDQIENAKMRLARLGIFDPENPPNIEVLPNEFDGSLRDVRVSVNETRTGSFMIGAAFNTNQGITGNITLNERNFDILRWPTSLDDFRSQRAFRGAGQEMRVEAAPGTQFSRYSVTWREPYLLDTPFGLTVSGYYYQRSYAEYNEHRYGGRVTLDRRLDPIWRASIGTRIEGVDITDVPIYAPFSISKDAGTHFLLGLRPGLTRDTRDSYLYPTSGSVLDMGVEQVLGNYTFPIGTVEFSKFFSTKYLAREDGSGKHVLGIRSQVSVTNDNAPVFERFYGGGIRSMRGFSFRGMGPFENGLAVGGKFAWVNTVEYQIPLFASDKFHWAFFVDHGTVEKDFAIHNYRVSVGTGLRLNLPMLGPLPLAVDFAVPLNKGPNDIKQGFNISVGLFGGPQ